MLIAVLVIVGGCALYIASQRALRRACAQLRLEFQEQMDAHARTLEARKFAQPKAVSAPANAALESEQVTPETLAAIGASVAALVGKEVRITSARSMPSAMPVGNSWAGQGRVTLQSSHDVRPVRNSAMSAAGATREFHSTRGAA
jgi:hypothetical protein